MKTVIPAGVLLLAGCAHTSHVQDLGNGMHAVTASANWAATPVAAKKPSRKPMTSATSHVRRWRSKVSRTSPA